MRHTTTGFACLLLASLLVGCGPDSESNIEPGVSCSGCEYDAIVPETALEFRVAWTARCRFDGPLPDTSTTKACHEQPFLARVRCEGAACESPATNEPARFDGEGTLLVRPLAAGDLKLTVELEHVESGDRFERTFEISVRNPDRVVIDCWWNSDPKGRFCTDEGSYKLCKQTWAPCPETLWLEPDGGNPLSLWIYGESQGIPVRLTANVSFEGFSPQNAELQYTPPHDQPEAVQEADRYNAQLTQPGSYAVHAEWAAVKSSLNLTAQ